MRACFRDLILSPNAWLRIPLCAGIASNAPHAAGLHVVDTNNDLQALKGRFPSVEKPYGVYFTPAEL